MILAIPAELSFCKAAWPWASLKVQKGHIKVNVKLMWDFGVEDVPVTLYGVCNSGGVIVFTSPFDLGLDWKFKDVQRSTSNLPKIFMWSTLLPVKLQHYVGKLRGVFNQFYKGLPFNPSDCDLVQNVKKVKCKNQTLLQTWCGEYLSEWSYNIIHTCLTNQACRTCLSLFVLIG